jgi:hypothetical protein
MSDPQRPFLDAGPVASHLPVRGLPGGPLALATLAAGLAVPGIALRWPGAVPGVVATGLVFAALLVAARPPRTLGWLVPPALRALEYGGILALAWRQATAPAAVGAFVLVAVVAYHHYDTVYRERALGTLPPDRLVVSLGGFDGRLAVLLLGAAAGHTTVTLWALVAWCGTQTVVESVRWWHRATERATNGG